MQYTFGNYVLDTQCYELRCAGELIKLRRKVFQVLVYLLAHRNRVVFKQELLEQLWPDQFVGDEALKSCIKTLRKALGEPGRKPRFVHTLHGQGYRFVAALERENLLPADSVPQHLPLPQDAAATSQAALPLSPFAPLLADTGSFLVVPLAEEHKQVTVLCGALAEPLLLAARLGPEAMHHLMHDVLALAHDTVQRYDGTISQVSGEGFMALFGAPVAQEDHALRAVVAGLALRQRLGEREAIPGQPPGVAIRLGLHTGPVVVGSLAYEPQRLYTALGHTLFLATVIQQRAGSDTLLVSTDTYALVQDEVQGEACGSVSLDAPSTPVPVYVIRALKQQRGGVPRRGARPLSRFVGRAQELALLQARQ